jgi:O-antigen/teichoic acid export membrane protein
MNRRQRFIWGAAAGYASTAINLVYTAVSIPLALHFLPKAEFALWAVIVQIFGYLMLLDMGMSSSVSRFLANHKDSMNNGEYGSILRTGRLVFLVQALGVFILGFACAGFLPSFLAIPRELESKFRILLAGYGLIQACGLALRAETAPLWSHQRIDTTQWLICTNLLVALLFMVIGFWIGLGVYSFLLGSFLGSALSLGLGVYACHYLRVYPERAFRGSFQKELFFRMFIFGRDVFLVQLGGLLCTGSQIILVTKLLGLEAAATFSIATKTLTMGQQIIGRILESAAPGLTELFVRGERARFALRFYQMTAVSFAMAVTLGILIMGINRQFVSLWTNGKIEWSLSGDLFMGAILIFTVASRCFQGAFGMTGDLARVRYLSLAEGMFLVIATLALGGRGGIMGILAVVLLSNILISFLGGGLQVARTIPGRLFWENIVWFLLAPCLLGIAVCWWAGGFFVSPLHQMLATMSWSFVSGFFLYKMLAPFFYQGKS